LLQEALQPLLEAVDRAACEHLTRSQGRLRAEAARSELQLRAHSLRERQALEVLPLPLLSPLLPLLPLLISSPTTPLLPPHLSRFSSSPLLPPLLSPLSSSPLSSTPLTATRTRAARCE
jgi:hypothetical protein